MPLSSSSDEDYNELSDDERPLSKMLRNTEEKEKFLLMKIIYLNGTCYLLKLIVLQKIKNLLMKFKSNQ